MNINNAFRLAFEHYQKGNLKKAVSICEKILKKHPDNINFLHFLGVIYDQLENYDAAIKYLKGAVQLDPNSFEGFYNLALTLEKRGKLNEAVDCYQKAIQINPDFIDAHINLGNVFLSEGKLDEALDCYQKITELNPNDARIYYNLGIAFQDKGQHDTAIFCYQKVLQLNPQFVDAYNNLGNALIEKKQFDEAIPYLQRAIQLNPNLATAYVNLGIALNEKGQFDEAISYFKKALQLDPQYDMAYYNLGRTFHYYGRLDEAITYFKKAIELNPTYADAHYGLSLTFLLSGNFREGWKEYEWRKKLKDYYQRNFPKPLWNGFNIIGKSILLHAEQGFGDNIQFIRYAPLVAQCGAKVFVECQKELKLLFQKVDGVNQVIARGEQLPEFDIHCPLLSLPLIFNTMIETIPTNIPYLSVDSILMQEWRNKVTNKHSKLKIGLVWATGIGDLSKLKSFPLDTFSPLAQFDNITFYSLQKGEAAKQAKNPPKGMKLIDYTDEINDFSDTAALIKNLDLVISADTAVAHLAGALGNPVWTLLPSVSIYQWMLHREDSPWYPTMKLFRQPSQGDWESVIDKVIDELQKLLDSN